MTNLAIDGYNLIQFRGGPSFGDMEGEREALLDQLKVYRKLRRVKVTVVFDGASSPGLGRNKERVSGIDVVYSSPGEEADDILKEMASEKGEGLTVVTSDRDVADFAESRGSVVLSSPEFDELLQGALFEELKGVTPEDEEEDEDTFGRKKGPSKRAPKKDRKKKRRKKKL